MPNDQYFTLFSANVIIINDRDIGKYCFIVKLRIYFIFEKILRLNIKLIK